LSSQARLKGQCDSIRHTGCERGALKKCNKFRSENAPVPDQIEISLELQRPCHVFIHDRRREERGMIEKTASLTCSEEESSKSCKNRIEIEIKWRCTVANETQKRKAPLCLI